MDGSELMGQNTVARRTLYHPTDIRDATAWLDFSGGVR
jgi:hypothetical protein